MSQPKFYQHLRAENDRNGNPRRLFAVYDNNGDVVDLIDEGYAGEPRWLRELKQLPSVNIVNAEYRSWLREFKDLVEES